MATRRQVLGWTGAVGLGGLGLATAGCDGSANGLPKRVVPDDALVLDAEGGVVVLSAATGRAVVPPGLGVLSGDGTLLARSETVSGGTRLTNLRLPGGQPVTSAVLPDPLMARAVSRDGTLVALADPTPAGGSPYRPAGRERTTIVVAGAAGQRNRLDLPGNLEPEAFDTTGSYLYVLDYLPPTAPDRYRVRTVQIATGAVETLLTRDKRPVPGGAEEEMRGEGRQAVFDGIRNLLFTLYTHQPDHLHTRDLIAGVRPVAPHVHAFVHTLSLDARWAYCVDLPAPFGANPAAGHAIAMRPAGSRLAVVDAGSGAVALIDPGDLQVAETAALRPPRGPVETASALFTRDGALLIAAGREVLTWQPGTAADDVTRWPVPAAIQGAALVGDRLYVGQPGTALELDPGTGQVRRRVPIPAGARVRTALTQAPA
jgi:hypothetical protein